MADFVFNIAKGKAGYYATLPAANDALVAVPIMTTGIEADATLKDKVSLSTLLAGTSDEQVTMGRKTLTGVTQTVDNTSDWLDVDAADFTWTAATGVAISAIVICYVPDITAGGTTAGAYDANLIPLTKHDFVVTPGGGDITAQIAAGGFYRAN